MVKPASASRSLAGRLKRGPFHSEPPTGIDPVTSFLPRTRSTTELGGQRVRTLPAFFGTVKSRCTFVADDTKSAKLGTSDAQLRRYSVTWIMKVVLARQGPRSRRARTGNFGGHRMPLSWERWRPRTPPTRTSSSAPAGPAEAFSTPGTTIRGRRDLAARLAPQLLGDGPGPQPAWTTPRNHPCKRHKAPP